MPIKTALKLYQVLRIGQVIGKVVIEYEIRGNYREIKSSLLTCQSKLKFSPYQLELHHLETKLKHLESDLAVSINFHAE